MRNPLLAHFHDTPALVAPEMRNQFAACLDSAAAIHARIESATDTPQMSDDFWFAADDWRSAYRPYVVKDGILHVPVKGVLLHNFAFALGGYATGYTYIWRAIERGLGDGNVRGIALVCDTPGGMVAGCFELVDKVFARRGEKPIRAFAQESAYSAGYAIASVADKIVVSRTGGVGSIGVVTAHTDVSQALAAAGVKITFIHAGKHKVDGNSYEALPDDVKARIQARIDELYDVFVSSVARNRAMDEQAIRDTEALTYTATKAVAEGLADSIGSLDDALDEFAANLDEEEQAMTKTVEQMAAEHAAALETAKTTAFAEGEASGLAKGLKEGATAERGRINSILASDEGKKRPVAALSASLKTDMTVEQATAFLGDLAEEKPAASGEQGKGKSDFAKAMDQGEHPELGATAGDPEQDKRPRHERALGYAGKIKPAA